MAHRLASSHAEDMVENRIELVKGMKQRVEEHKCYFDFYSDSDCSPYKAILQALEQRSQKMPR